MRVYSKLSVNSIVVCSVILGFYNCSVFVSGFPQWVWNPDANTSPSGTSLAGNKVIFAGDTSSGDKEKIPIKIVDTQARLFPSIVSAISNTINGGSGGSRPPISLPGGSSSSSCSPPNSGACIGGMIAQVAIEQGINAGSSVAQNPSVTGIFGSILQNLLGGGASTLPAGIGGGGNSNKEPGGGSSSGSTSCSCVSQDACFLPSKPSGSCDGGNINCCSTTRGTRTVFPDEDNSKNSAQKTVTRSQIRRALLKNIVRGSGSVLDDTLDLVLHPFLTKEDQLKVATRILGDE